MRPLWIVPALLARAVLAADTTTASTISDTAALTTLSGTNGQLSIDVATGSVTYESVTTTTTMPTGSISAIPTSSGTGNVTGTATSTSTSDTVTVLVGSQGTSQTSNATGTATATAPTVTNTQPCNGYAEFCSRNYSNVTYVAAHNSPFDRQGNLASNQQYGVTTQLNDGIRMLQFQAHYQNETMYLCHTSCDLLNVGTLENYFTTVVQWLQQHPYEVITILMGNYDLVPVGNFTSPIINSGLSKYAYYPSEVPMSLDSWPQLSNMIISGKRAVIFMDYQANQTEVPYILDEFSQLWETPFSPTDRQFPCTVQRPPGLSPEDARNRMYMANHNLNLDVSFAGVSLLVPNTALINVTNGVSGFGSLGAMAENCTADWNRPPNFLLVDYYNEGSVNGSVFEVAAQMNNVTYNGHCCGTTTSAAPISSPSNRLVGVLLAVAISVVLTIV
ncbi:PLC-like phosphodiesterase [Talaromyces proteolyticus]|uniref:PLC-like phosphodiesterase n=1 Tax=Talaromyces proteolyticus TaxID=1131652 RepID=A0AAD4KNQ4_9EURO|nr:PLC-like phosphodiesterase [Talaromyces proteolyticus]KAH8693280.1 PLC-like phosphodiesterase [Talaromyces proteolyticus]